MFSCTFWGLLINVTHFMIYMWDYTKNLLQTKKILHVFRCDTIDSIVFLQKFDGYFQATLAWISWLPLSNRNVIIKRFRNKNMNCIIWISLYSFCKRFIGCNSSSILFKLPLIFKVKQGCGKLSNFQTTSLRFDPWPNRSCLIWY